MTKFELKNVHRIAVAGAGTMGAAIAQLCSMAGYKTVLYDIKKDALKHGIQTIKKNLDKGIQKGKVTQKQRDKSRANLTTTTDFDDLKADFVIEAVVEKLAVKHALFHELAKLNGPKTILATNTSSIPITRIARPIDHPERVVGMHFFNPAHIMKLVEVIAGAATDHHVVQTTKHLAGKLGKRGVIAYDAPGFIVNRVARHFYVEGLKLAEENVCDYETIDELLENAGFRMGPFRLMDLIGVDANFLVTKSMFESFHYEPRFRPSRLQERMVDAGHHGRKSGKGFYAYD